jgi:hypothetical protein
MIRSLLFTIFCLVISFNYNDIIIGQDMSDSIKSETYHWKNVQIVGGGFVSGFVIHPAEKNLRYCRTDMGGAYKWNEEQKRWEPLLDWISYKDLNLMGIESIALDPSDPNMLYLACGTYTNEETPDGAILRSDDRGKTFQRINVPFKFGGNENGRGNGERMIVDPNNGNIIYLGTRHNGLWKSIDKGITWNQITGFPDINETPPTGLSEQELQFWNWGWKGNGIVVVLIDPKSGNKTTGSSDIYTCISLMNKDNFFVSKDFGVTWKLVEGQPRQYRPNHAVISSSGIIYISYGLTPGPWRMRDGGIWKFDIDSTKWTDITPDKPDPSDNNKAFGYASVAVDPQNPQVIIASSFYRTREAGGEDIFRSIDGGKSWKPVFGSGGKYDYSLAPYVKNTGIHWLFDIEIDPFNSDHALFTTGFGGFETFNLSALDKGNPTIWSVMTTGIEETVALDLLSPAKGAPLISAIGDYGGFVHWNLDKPAPEGNFTNPHFGNTEGLASAAGKPELIVRVGNSSRHDSNKNIGYSTDGGVSWKPTDTMPDAESRYGSVAVSSDGVTWIWSPKDSREYYTKDNGSKWIKIETLPENTRVIADPVNSLKFYAIDLFAGKLFISSNGSFSFEEYTLDLPGGLPVKTNKRGDGRGGQDRIYATPGLEGDLWIAAFDGLYHSKNEGGIFVKMDKVEEIHAFGFGKPATGQEFPAIYLVGTINNIRGIFRSDNEAKDWVRINDDQHQWGLVLQITGDPKLYGRVYVGTHGRGIFYGDPL